MSKESKILLLVYCSFLVEILFNLIPYSANQYHFFPFFDGYTGWDGAMTLQTYVHKFCSHVSRLMIFYAFYLEIRRPALQVIFWLEFLDLIDFVLCYNYKWFTWLGYGVEFNDVTFVIISILIIQTSWKHKLSY